MLTVCCPSSHFLSRAMTTGNKQSELVLWIDPELPASCTPRRITITAFIMKTHPVKSGQKTPSTQWPRTLLSAFDERQQTPESSEEEEGLGAKYLVRSSSARSMGVVTLWEGSLCWSYFPMPPLPHL